MSPSWTRRSAMIRTILCSRVIIASRCLSSHSCCQALGRVDRPRWSCDESHTPPLSSNRGIFRTPLWKSAASARLFVPLEHTGRPEDKSWSRRFPLSSRSIFEQKRKHPKKASSGVCSKENTSRERLVAFEQWRGCRGLESFSRNPPEPGPSILNLNCKWRPLYCSTDCGTVTCPVF